MKKFWDLFIPLLLGNVTIAVSGLVDTLYLSHFSAKHVAVLAIAISLYSMIFIFGFGLLQGMMQTLAEAKGRGELHQIDLIVKQGIWSVLLWGLFGICVLSHADSIVDLLGADATLKDMILVCLKISMFIIPVQLLLRVFFIVTQTCGQAKLVFYGNILFLIAKLILSGVFIFGIPLWGLKAYGVYGAFISSFLAYCIILITFYILLMDKSHRLQWKAPFFNFDILIKILRIGIPASIVIFIDVFAFTSISLLAVPLGDIALSANQIVMVAGYWLFNVINALIVTFSILLSIKIGEGHQEQAWQLSQKAVYIVLMAALILSFSLFLFQKQFVVLFTSDQFVASMVLSLIVLVCLFHIADAMLAIAVNLLRCWQVTLLPMFIYSFILLIVGLGGGWYFAFHPMSFLGINIASMGIHSFWVFATFAYASSAILCLICLYYRKYLN